LLERYVGEEAELEDEEHSKLYVAHLKQGYLAGQDRSVPQHVLKPIFQPIRSAAEPLKS
jgi:hypothetical protein